MTPFSIAGEDLQLLPERAVYWPARETLLVADPHFGKAAAFRAGGLPVSEGTTAETLKRLTDILERCATRRVVFLGDFLHARAGRSPQTFTAITEWRKRYQSIEFVLVRGNHDHSAGDPPAELDITCCNAPMIEGPFALVHHPKAVDGYYSLAGHVHPGALLSGSGRQYERLPCFWFQKDCGVLPAFGEFTGLALIEPAMEDRVFVVADRAVLSVVTKSSARSTKAT